MIHCVLWKYHWCLLGFKKCILCFSWASLKKLISVYTAKIPLSFPRAFLVIIETTSTSLGTKYPSLEERSGLDIKRNHLQTSKPTLRAQFVSIVGWIELIAKQTQKAYRQALHLFPTKPTGWAPKVITTSGEFEYGIDEAWQLIQSYFNHINAIFL